MVLQLYYITDRRQFAGDAQEQEQRLLAKIAECAAAGLEYIQLREKDLESRALERLALKAMAARNATAVAAGHIFVVVMTDGYPINVLGRIKDVPEVCRIFCATANPVLVVVAESDQGRGVLGVIDGVIPKGVEGAEDAEKRRGFLRMIGYKR